MNENTKKIVTVGMLSALAYLIMVVGRIPLVLFLKYDPKDIVITIGGFIYGPITSFFISLIVSLAECFTVSNDGFIGLIMNILATFAFSGTAAYIYKKKHTLKGAITGLAAGCFMMTIVMLLWNYLMTPLYMGTPRAEVVKLLIPAFLPFNLIKGGLNAGITLLVYKPVVTALRKANLIPAPSQEATGKENIGTVVVSTVVVASCILFTLAVNGKL